MRKAQNAFCIACLPCQGNIEAEAAEAKKKEEREARRRAEEEARLEVGSVQHWCSAMIRQDVALLKWGTTGLGKDPLVPTGL